MTGAQVAERCGVSQRTVQRVKAKIRRGDSLEDAPPPQIETAAISQNSRERSRRVSGNQRKSAAANQKTSEEVQLPEVINARIDSPRFWDEVQGDPEQPEFFAPYYLEIQEAFKKKFGGNFQPEKKSWIQKLLGAKV